MMKYVSLREKTSGIVSKAEFESIVMFLSRYSKAKDMNGRLHSLFTVVDERNSESSFIGVLQYKERLSAFVEQKTDFVDYGSYYKYLSCETTIWDINAQWSAIFTDFPRDDSGAKCCRNV